MKLKMNIATRLKLSELLSDQAGSYSRLKAIRAIRENMSLSDEEVVATGYVEDIQADGRVNSKWNATKDPLKECEFTDVLVDVIVKKLKDLDKKEQLTDAQMPLYEAFVQLQEEMKKVE